ncbi:MAG: hypothetical protein Q8O88_01325 [bacterium]|nr:hypothetical protein [bacterium]
MAPVKHGFFILQDHSLPTGSRVFSGSPIYMWVQRCTIGGQINSDTNFRPNQDNEINMAASSDDAADIGSHWNRRKSHVQVTGMSQFQVNLTGAWEVSQVGSADSVGTPPEFGTGSPVRLSPYAIVRLAMCAHTYHLRGGTALQSIIDPQANDFKEGTHVGSLYSGSGIPVVIASYSLEDTAQMQDFVSWTIGFVEDKDRLK